MAKDFKLGLLLTMKSNAEKVLKALSKHGNEAGKTLKAASAKSSELSGSFSKIDKTGEKAAKSVKKLSENAKKLHKASISVDKLSRSFSHLEEIQKKTFSQRLGDRARGITKWANDVSLSMQAFSQVKTLGGNVSAFGGRMVGSLQKPINAMARLENGMVSLKSVMLDSNGEVKESFNSLSEAVIKTANKLPATADEMYQAAANAVAKGMDANALAQGGFEEAAKFAVGLKLGYDEALDYAGLISRTWGVNQADLAGEGKIYDLLARVSGRGVSVDDMVTMIAKTGASAGALGQKGFSDLAARIPYFSMIKAASGSSADVLATGFSQLESRVLDTNRVNAASKAAGAKLNFVGQDGKYLGFENLVAQLEKLKDLVPTKRRDAIAALFGDSTEIQSLVSILLEKGGRSGAARELAAINNQASLKNRVDIQLGSFTAQWNAFTGTLDTAMGKIGMNFNPALTKLAGYATSAADKLSKLAEEYPGITQAVGYTTVGLGGTAIVAGKTLEIAGQLGMALPLIEKVGPKVLEAAKGMGKFAGKAVPAAIIIAGMLSWKKVFEDFSDVTTEVGRDFRILTSNFEGFSAVLGKLKGFASYLLSGGHVNAEAAAASLKVDALAVSDKNLQAEIRGQQIINQGGDHIVANFTINNNGKDLDRGELEKTVKNVFQDIKMDEARMGQRRYRY